MALQSPYSLDLSSCHFPLSSINRFGTLENIKKVVTDKLRAISVPEFQHFFNFHSVTLSLLHTAYKREKIVSNAEWLPNAITFKATILDCSFN